MASKAAALAQLRELRKSGKSRLTSYQVEEAQDLYDEVDEEGYKKVVRGRLDQDDFVVDDNGGGYADDGREDWNDRRQAYDTESDEEHMPVRGKAAKRKREEDAAKNERNATSISNYFNAASAKSAPKPKAKVVASADDAAFMAGLLGDMESSVSTSRRAPMRPVKNESRRKTRVLSPPVQEPRKPSRRYEPASPTHARENMSPAPVSDDDRLPPPLDNDVPMSDNIPPSSPIARAVERKSEVAVKQEDSDDDMMEVAAVVARTSGNTADVNIAGSRPAPKIKKQEKTDYPTPESSSPTRAPASDVIDASSWNAITSKLNVMSSPSNDTAAVGKLQEKDVVEEDGSLRFFWIDYMELNGSLLLFGKVRNKTNDTYASAFVKVDKIFRNLYFLPREHKVKNGKKTEEEVDMGDVYQEVDSLMSRNKVNMHKIKACNRKYAFEMPDIPRQAEYLKLLYPYDKPPLPMDLQGETFSHVFGTNTSIFEQFVLWKSIMGPCWLNIRNANFNAVTNASWCKLELQVPDAKNISPLGDTDNLEAPPLTMMSIAIRTAMNVKENKQEIIMASARVYKDIQLSDTTPPEKLPCQTITILRPPGDGFPAGFRLDVEKHPGTVKMEKSEVGVLSLFMAHIQRFDPDVLAGHRLDEDYSILLNRLKQRNIPGWHRVGRLRRSEWPKNMGKGGGSFFVERQIASGRLLCDLANDMGKSMMTKCQSWSLAEMCELVLGKDNIRREIDNETALKTWATSREGLMNYVRHAEADTYFVAAIALKVQMLPLTKVLTNLAGNSWARTLSGTRAERNEYILLHEFTRNKYICPDKVSGKGKKEEQQQPEEGDEVADTKKKDKYKGGLVFEPEKGLYDRVVLVMDFNSLYPSIIQEYNICFTTVERSGFSEENEIVPDAPQADQELGVLPRLIAKLVNRRREVKKLMKDKSATTDQLATWDIKQLALKLTANSMYGCLGYTRSRFYARPLAVLTTYKGREILRSTKELAESKQLQVIYGDTDSVMINTNVDNIQEALKVGNEFKRSVNERYKLLEIDIDNIFRRVLLHAKKKYAAINMVEVNGKFVEKLEVKGLDMKRREYCALSKETSSSLLNMLLSGEDPETVVEKIHDYLRELGERMRQFNVPVQKYTIFTQLSKNPQDYPNAKSMPAVQVALKLAAKGKNIRAKDVMSFIITGNNNGSQEHASANALPPDEVLKSKSELKPDIDYYLHKQILPPVERLCQPITFTNIPRLAECLGLDTSKYRISSVGSNANPQEELIQPLDSQVPDHIRFKDCAPLHFTCLSCRQPFTYRSMDEDSAVICHAGFRCPVESCGSVMKTLTAVAQTEHNIRQCIARYYEAWLACDDPDCGTRTRQVNVYGTKCLGPQGLGRGCMGRMSFEISEKKMYNQLLYWERAWDVSKAKERAASGQNAGGVKTEASMEGEKIAALAEINRERFETVRGVVRGYLDKSGRQWVNMGALFRFAG